MWYLYATCAENSVIMRFDTLREAAAMADMLRVSGYANAEISLAGEKRKE